MPPAGMTVNSYEVVCSVVIGHSVTGYSYRLLSDPRETLYLNSEWNDFHPDTYHTATSVLVNKQGLFEEFGHNAEYKYHKLCSLGQVSDCKLFKAFTHQLHQQQVNITSCFQ